MTTASRTAWVATLTLEITNNLPHRLPTGEFGFRVLELEAVVMDSQGRRVGLERRAPAPELSTALGARGTLTWNLEVPADAARAVVSLRRRSYDEADAVMLANVELSL